MLGKQMLGRGLSNNQRNTTPKSLRNLETFRWHIWSINCWFLIIIATCHFTSIVQAKEEERGVSTSHITIPAGGQFNVTCWDYGNSSNISFEYNGMNYTEPNDHIKEIEKKKFQLSFQNVSEQNSDIKCFANDQIVSTIRLIVGTAPQGGDDLNCKIYDYQFGKCFFKYPKNHVKTTYQVVVQDESTHPCKPIENDTRVLCEIPYSNAIRKNHITVTLIGSNALQQNVSLKTAVFSTAQIVVPPRIQFQKIDGQEVTTTSDSIGATFIIATYKFYEENPLKYEITVTPEHLPATTYDENNVKCTGIKCNLTINDLNFPNWEYKITLRARATKTLTKDDNSFWGETAEYKFMTLPRLPDRPPKTLSNSFSVTSNRYRLYWSPLEPHEHNAEHFQYEIEVRGADNKTIETKTSSEMWIDLDLTRNDMYTCNIRSTNVLGKSKNWTSIHIPATSNISNKLKDFYVTRDQNVYNVSWQADDSSTGVPSYTVFWCLKGSSYFDCKNYLNFKEIPRGAPTSYRINSTNNNLNVGVAANYLHGSTGIQWVSCIWNANDALPSIKPILNSTGETNLTIEWELKSDFCANIVHDYKLIYQDVSGSSESSESSKQMTCHVTGNQTCTIQNLKPFTKYAIAMHLNTHWNQSAANGQSITATTFESEPSVPRDLRRESSGSTTINVSWLPPERTNGHITSYTIWYRLEGQSKGWSQTYKNSTQGERMYYNLTELSPYSKYTINVTARNSRNESKHCENREFHTKPGIPPAPNFTTDENGEVVSIKWDVPEKSSYTTEFYIIAIVKDYKDGNQDHMFTVLNDKSWICDIQPVCQDSLKKVEIQVAKVNALVPMNDFDNSTFYNNITNISAPIVPGNWKFDQNLCGNQVWPLNFSYYSESYIEYMSKRFDEIVSGVLFDNNSYYLQSEWKTINTQCENSNIALSTKAFLSIVIMCAILFLAGLIRFLIRKWSAIIDIGVVFPDELSFALDKSSTKLSSVLAWPDNNSMSPISVGPHTRIDTIFSLALPVEDEHNQGESNPTYDHANGVTDEQDRNEDIDDERSSQSTETIGLHEISNSTPTKYSLMHSIISERRPTELTTPIGEYPNFPNDSASSMVVAGHGAAEADNGGYVTQSQMMTLNPVGNGFPKTIPSDHVHNGYISQTGVELVGTSSMVVAGHGAAVADNGGYVTQSQMMTLNPVGNSIPKTIPSDHVHNGYISPTGVELVGTSSMVVAGHGAAMADNGGYVTQSQMMTLNPVGNGIPKTIPSDHVHNGYISPTSVGLVDTTTLKLKLNSYVTPTLLHEMEHMLRSTRAHVD